MKKFITAISLLLASALLAGCAWVEAWGESFNREWEGVSATMTTYNQNGVKIDQVQGTSFHVERDDKFDSTNSEGGSNADSQVLMISLGSDVISHVGSSLVIEEDGLTDIMAETGSYVDIVNTEPGTPWLNLLYEDFNNMWKGEAKTILIRSQDGTPIAVYAGNEVEILSTNVPKSTWFRVDGKFLFVYRSDYTVYSTALLKG